MRYILTDDQIKNLARELIDCIVLIMNTENPEKKPIGEMFDSKVLEQIFYNATSNEVPYWATHFVAAEEIDVDQLPNPYRSELICK